MATTSEARRDFQHGLIRGFTIERVPMETRAIMVTLLYTGRATKDREPLGDTRSKKARMFKTYDAAVSALEQIGFNVAVIGS